ncbi:MAG: flagellar filament capping protein FliD [Planctomycetaceae bacterium]
MGITIDGLNSGLDTQGIVDSLLEIQQAQLDRQTAKKQAVLNRQAIFQSLEAQVVTFRSTAARLSRIQNNVFESRTVSVSDEAALVATTKSNSATGIYSLTVESLAQAHQVASQSYADANAQITQGTFTIRQGSRPSVDITIDSSNDTLQGLADSINLADTGVSASVIQDGTSGGGSYRLLLTSSETGESNEISVTNNLAASSGNAVQPSFDFGNPVQAATNARVRLGSGAGALTVENDSNRLDNVISGVTIDLLKADATKPISVRIQQDTSTAVSAVQDFVDSYNSLVDFVKSQSGYNPETQVAGPLLGDRNLQQIESDIRSAVLNVVPGLSSKSNRLSTIGISLTDAGKLTFNSAKLQQALSGQTPEVTARSVRSLFALDGTSTNPNVEFVLGSTRTRESTSPIQVDITQAAERAAIQSTNVLSGSTVIDGSNNELQLVLDGATLTVSLKEGTYTDQELAAEVESAINAHPDAVGRSVFAGLKDNGSGSNYLASTSQSFGSTSQVTIQSGSALTALGLDGTENEAGKDVQGNFIVDGVVEEAVGRGRLLSGKLSNTVTADLQVRVSLSAAQVTSGVEAELTVSRGVAARLDRDLGSQLDSQTGIFKTIKDRYTQEADSLQAAFDRQQEIFDKQQVDLKARFTALEQALGNLQTTSAFLTQQFASLSSLKSTKK